MANYNNFIAISLHSFRASSQHDRTIYVCAYVWGKRPLQCRIVPTKNEELKHFIAYVCPFIIKKN